MSPIYRNRDQKDESSVIVLRQTKPGVCGGTDATQDTAAPKTILSREMTLFSATSALLGGDRSLGYVSAFAVSAGEGTFLFLETGESFRYRDEKQRIIGVVKENPFPALVTLARDCDLAKDNGFHSTTHGLGENYGGEIDVWYASGETISVSNNQTPVLTDEAGGKIAALYRALFQGPIVPQPDPADLQAIRFREAHPNGSFTQVDMTVTPDGAHLRRHDHPETGHDSDTTGALTADEVSAIRGTMEKCAILAWADLPDDGFPHREKRTLTFTFADGRTITVPDDRLLPQQIRGGFFSIQHPLTSHT